MHASIGAVSYERETPLCLGEIGQLTPRPREYSDATAEKIGGAVKSTVDEALQQATGVLRRRRALLDQASRLLLERETLTEDDLRALLQRHPDAKTPVVVGAAVRAGA